MRAAAALAAALLLLASAPTAAHSTSRRRHHSHRAHTDAASHDAAAAVQPDDEQELWDSPAAPSHRRLPSGARPTANIDEHLAQPGSGARGSLELMAAEPGVSTLHAIAARSVTAAAKRAREEEARALADINQTIVSQQSSADLSATLPATPGLEMGAGTPSDVAAAAAGSSASAVAPPAGAVSLLAPATQSTQLFGSLDANTNSVSYLGSGDGSTTFNARLDSMEKCLKQLLSSVETLSASVSSSGGGGGGGTNEFTLGYKQGFADGYSHGFHEAKLAGRDQPPNPATADIAQQTLDQIQKASAASGSYSPLMSPSAATLLATASSAAAPVANATAASDPPPAANATTTEAATPARTPAPAAATTPAAAASGGDGGGMAGLLSSTLRMFSQQAAPHAAAAGSPGASSSQAAAPAAAPAAPTTPAAAPCAAC